MVNILSLTWNTFFTRIGIPWSALQEERLSVRPSSDSISPYQVSPTRVELRFYNHHHETLQSPSRLGSFGSRRATRRLPLQS